MKRFCLIVVVLYAPAFLAQSTAATGPGHIHYAEQYAGPDMGSKIDSAIADFGPAPACGEIYIPQGIHAFATTIEFANRKGCTFHGAGAGSEGHPGTVLKWTGPAGGTMLSVLGNVRGGSFFDFALDGNGRASRCLDVRGTDRQTTDANDFYRIVVWNCTGPDAIGLHVGDTTVPDLSSNYFHEIHISYSSGGMLAMLQQDGAQTVANHYYNSTFSYTGSARAPAYFAHFVLGDVHFDHNTLLGLATTAKIAVEAGALWANIENNYDEATASVETSGPSVLFTAGSNPWRATLRENRWAWNATSPANKVIESYTNRSISFTDNEIDSTSGRGHAQVYFENAGAGQASLIWTNNKINGPNNFPVKIGKNMRVRADETANLCNSAPSCPVAMQTDENGQARTRPLDVAPSDNPVASPMSPPKSDKDSCAPGSWAFDSKYLYVCVAPNSWRRAALSDW